MNEIMTAEQAIRMFTRGTNMRWRVIRPDQVNAYQKNVFQLCLDRQCRQSVWVVPKHATPSYDLYDKVMQRLSYATQNAVAFIPKLKFDLDDFKTIHLTVTVDGALLDIAIKPSADILVFHKDTRAPFSLSYARGIHLKYSGTDSLSNYLKTWCTVAPDGATYGGIRLLFGPKGSAIMLTIAMPTGDEQIKAKLDLPPSDMSLGSWGLERHVSLDLTITNITDKKSQPMLHPSTSSVNGGEIATAIGFGSVLLLGTIFSGGLDLVALVAGMAAG